MVATMRAKGTGSFDLKKKTWIVKGEGIAASLRKLSQLYGVTFGDQPSQWKKESVTYWRRYLQDLKDDHRQTLQQQQDDHRQARRESGIVSERIASIEAMIARFRLQSGSEAILERLEGDLAETLDAPLWSDDFANMPILHPTPEAQAAFDKWNLEGEDEFTIRTINALIPPAPTPPTINIQESMKAEAERFVSRKREATERRRRHAGKRVVESRSWRQPKQAIDLFLSMGGGDFLVSDKSVLHHWRAFWDTVTNHPQWGERTKSNMVSAVASFLRQVGAEHNLHFGFLKSKGYRLQTPDGQKIQYTLDQVQTALKHATGRVRLSLLFGLNCGFYWGDVAELTHDKFDGVYLSLERQKNDSHTSKIVGKWFLWEETKRLLTFDLKPSCMSAEYGRFARKHDLPPFMALRKTTAQTIHERFVRDTTRHDQAKNDDPARLFRCEGIAGTHGKNYIRNFTPPQVALLTDALQQVAKVYGIE